MDIVTNNYIPGDHRLIEQIMCELKSQGIFDQFRKECISDVDTKPAYQNLRQRVEGSVSGFLTKQRWTSDMNKNQVREMLRKNIYESGYLETGVERIVDQVVNPKINTIFLPKVEDVVYRFFGIEKPNRERESTRWDNLQAPLNIVCTQNDLLPNDLEAISPDSVTTEKKEEVSIDDQHDVTDGKNEEDESPPFEPIDEQINFNVQVHEENSVDSHLSGFSGLVSHDSNNSRDTKPLPVDIINQDSRMSLNSSESHLSIITSEDNTKMEVCEDSSKSLKSLSSYSKQGDKVDLDDDLFKGQTSPDLNMTVETIQSPVEKNFADSKYENPDDTQTTKSSKSDEKLKISEKNKTSSKDKKSDKNHSPDKSKSREDRDKKDLKGKRDERSKKSDKYRKSEKVNETKKDDKDKKNDKIKKDDRHKRSDKDDRDKKDKNKRDDRERTSSRDSKSKHSSRDKDRNIDRKDSKSTNGKGDNKRDKEKGRDEKTDPKDDKSEKSSSSKYKNSSSSLKEKEKSSKTEESSRDKTRSHSSSSNSKRESSKSHDDKSKSSEKNRKDESQSKSSNSKSKDRKREKSSKDDHYSSKDKKNYRRSADRDSDGQSNRHSSSASISSSSLTQTQKTSQESSTSTYGSGSGDSGNSESVEVLYSQEPDSISDSLSNSEVIISSPSTTTTIPEVQIVRFSKPKFASNIHEAMRLMKIRKQLKKLEKENQLSLARVDVNTNFANMVPVSSFMDSESSRRSPSSINTGEVKKKPNVLRQNSSLKNENVIMSNEIKEVVPPLKNAIISQESWDALEAKLLQQVGGIDFNSYESPDIDDVYDVPSTKPKAPKLSVKQKSNESAETVKNEDLSFGRKENEVKAIEECKETMQNVEPEITFKDVMNLVRHNTLEDNHRNSNNGENTLKVTKVYGEATRVYKNVLKNELYKVSAPPIMGTNVAEDSETQFESYKKLNTSGNVDNEPSIDIEINEENDVIEKKDGYESHITVNEEESTDSTNDLIIEGIVNIDVDSNVVDSVTSDEEILEKNMERDENLMDEVTRVEFNDEKLEVVEHVLEESRNKTTNSLDTEETEEVDDMSGEDADVCTHLEEIDGKTSIYLQKLLKKLESDIMRRSLKIENVKNARTWIDAVPKVGMKRKLPIDEHNDFSNNNYKKKEIVVSKRARKNGKTPTKPVIVSKKFESKETTDISTDDSFSLPLSPADSDHSIEKKIIVVTPINTVKPRRSRGGVTNQRYSSEDLYKPRNTFSSSRRSAKDRTS